MCVCAKGLHVAFDKRKTTCIILMNQLIVMCYMEVIPSYMTLFLFLGLPQNSFINEYMRDYILYYVCYVVLKKKKGIKSLKKNKRVTRCAQSLFQFLLQYVGWLRYYFGWKGAFWHFPLKKQKKNIAHNLYYPCSAFIFQSKNILSASDIFNYNSN